MPFLTRLSQKTLKREWAFAAFLWWLAVCERYIATANDAAWQVAMWSSVPVWALVFAALGLEAYYKQILPSVKR